MNLHFRLRETHNHTNHYKLVSSLPCSVKNNLPLVPLLPLPLVTNTLAMYGTPLSVEQYQYQKYYKGGNKPNPNC